MTARIRRRPVLSIVGDSITEGSAENSGPTWPWLMGLPVELDVHASGGTGYVATNPAVHGDTTFATNAAGIRTDADAVVFFGSRNDGDADIEDAAREALAVASSRAPGATLLVIAPFWVAVPPPSWQLVHRAQLRAVAREAGAGWLDPGEEGWRLPVDSPLIGADGVHPTDAGHRTMADLLVPPIAEILRPRAPSSGEDARGTAG